MLTNYCHFFYCAVVGINVVDYFTAWNMDSVKCVAIYIRFKDYIELI